jgi:hypothetical protein
MNARNDQAPFSLPEFAAASIALAAVAVIAFQGILGPRESNLSTGNLSRPRLTSASGRQLQVSSWRLDSEDANVRMPPIRSSDIVAVRKIEPPSGPEAAGSPGPRPGANGGRALTFFAEASPETIVELVLPDIGGQQPLMGPRDLFHMKNAIVVQPASPIRDLPIRDLPVRDATTPSPRKR